MSDQRGLIPPAGPLSRALWNFSSLWFIVPQGTGIIAVILYRLKYQFNGLKTLATIVWIYTIVQLGLFLVLYLLRTFLHPRHVLHQLRNNSAETSCLCCIAIAFTSILQMAVFKYGDTAGLAIYILWWVNTGMDMIACMVIPFIHLKMQQSGTRHLHADMLMPFLAALTSAAGGGAICQLAHRGRSCPRCFVQHHYTLSVLRSPVPDSGHGVPGYDYVRPLRTGFGRAPGIG